MSKIIFDIFIEFMKFLHVSVHEGRPALFLRILEVIIVKRAFILPQPHDPQ